MNLQVNDILTRKTSEGTTLWLRQNLIMAECKISEEYAKIIRYRYLDSVSPCFRGDNILPDTGKSWRWARIGGRFYYDYDRIPDKAPVHYRSMLPTRDQLLKMVEEVGQLARSEMDEQSKRLIRKLGEQAIDTEDIPYYMWQCPAKGFSPDKARQLALARAYLRKLYELIQDGSYKQHGFDRKEQLISLATDVISAQQLEGLRITTPGSLRKKLFYFPLGDTSMERTYLVSDKYGNQNARVVGTVDLIHPETGEIMPYDVHEALMYYGYMNPFRSNKYTARDVYEKVYTPSVESLGIPAVSYRSICRYTAAHSNDALSAKERHGAKYFSDQYKPYVPAFELKFAGTLWAADGSGSKLAYHYADKDGKLKQATLYTVRFFDLASRKIVGWAAGPGGEKENITLVMNALKMAIHNSGGRGARELVTDNGPAFSKAEIKSVFSVLFSKVTNITPGNSQANPAEILFQNSNAFSREFDNWVYSSFDAKLIDNIANPDYFPKVENLPDIHQAYDQLARCVDEWNTTPWNGATPDERFKTYNETCMGIDPKALRYAFGNRTQVDLDYQRGFVRPWKGERQFLFEIPDWQSNIEMVTVKTGSLPDVKVRLFWDETGCDIYNLDGEYIITAVPSQKAARSEFESFDGFSEAMAHHMRRKTLMEQAADSFRDEVVQSADVLKYGHYLNGKKKVKDEYNDAMESAMEEKLRPEKKAKKQKQTPKSDKDIIRSAIDDL